MEILSAKMQKNFGRSVAKTPKQLDFLLDICKMTNETCIYILTKYKDRFTLFIENCQGF